MSVPTSLPKSLMRRVAARCATGSCALVLATLLVACGGEDTSAGEEASLPEGKAARLVVQPAALMLTAAGDSRPLRVQAFDAAGRQVRTRVSWRSTRSTQVQVDANGQVKALQALGATQVIAEADGAESAPVLVSVVQMAPGVLLVDDQQIVGEAAPVDPNAEADADNPYEVLISGITPPAVGSLLLGREGKMVGGEVVSAQVEGSAVRVRLRLVAPSRLVQAAQIQEVVDLSRLPLEVPPEVAALYDVTRVDDEYIFTPKPGSSAELMRPQVQPSRKGALAAGDATAGKRPTAAGKIKFGRLECEVVGPDLPIALSQPAQFSLKFQPRLEIDYDARTGLRKLLLKGELATKIKLALQVNVAGLVNATCEAKLYERLVPAPGWVGLILAGELAAGPGVELEVTGAVPLVGIELTAESKGPFEIGLDCAGDTCQVVHQYNPVSTVTPAVRVPQTALLRTEAFAFAYGFAKLKTGATLLGKLRADIITARGGVKLEGSFAPVGTQVAPADVDYRSDYKLALLAEVAAGSTNRAGESAFRKLLQKLGIFKFSTLKTQLNVPLGVSPKGALTVDRASFVDGERLRFKVTLDPETVNFPVVGYNVSRVSVFRAVPGQPARELVSGQLSSGQLSLDLSWVAEGTAGEPPGGEFYAFIDTTLPTPFKLEIAKAQVVPVVLSGQMQISFSETTQSTLSNGSSVRLRSLELSSAVEQQGSQLVMLSPRSTSSDVLDSVTRSTITRRGCTWTVATTRHDETRGSTAPADRVGLDLNFNGDQWRINEVAAPVLKQRAANSDARAENPTGDCSQVDLSPSSTSDTFPVVAGNFNAPFSSTSIPWFSGALTVAADGSRSLQFSDTRTDRIAVSDGTVSQSSTLVLQLSEANPASLRVDLALSLIAPQRAEPESALTYAVNLVNTGASAATAVRAEFNLPPGFAILGTTGWSGCAVNGTTAVCQAPSLASGERRAFLIDVQAPARAGSFVVLARVSSLELESNFADNHAQAVTAVP